jgi:hypothetical protein
MIGFLANIVVIVVVGWIVLRRGRDRRVESISSPLGLRIAALIPLVPQGAIYLLFGVAEMVGGDLSGGMHLLQLAVIVLLAILAWMRPLEGGIGLVLAGVASAVPFISAMATAGSSAEPTVVSPALLILAVPQILSGVLFFIAGMLGRRVASHGPTSSTQRHQDTKAPRELG